MSEARKAIRWCWLNSGRALHVIALEVENDAELARITAAQDRIGRGVWHEHAGTLTLNITTAEGVARSWFIATEQPLLAVTRCAHHVAVIPQETTSESPIGDLLTAPTADYFIARLSVSVIVEIPAAPPRQGMALSMRAGLIRPDHWTMN